MNSRSKDFINKTEIKENKEFDKLPNSLKKLFSSVERDIKMVEIMGLVIWVTLSGEKLDKDFLKSIAQYPSFISLKPVANNIEFTFAYKDKY